jgi:hypothetical protein
LGGFEAYRDPAYADINGAKDDRRSGTCQDVVHGKAVQELNKA